MPGNCQNRGCCVFQVGACREPPRPLAQIVPRLNAFASFKKESSYGHVIYIY